jgi:hypothetical protein
MLWAIDMKFGHTDIISCIRFCDFLEKYSSLKTTIINNTEKLYINSNNEKSIDESANNYVITNKISEFSMEDSSKISTSPKNKISKIKYFNF